MSFERYIIKQSGVPKMGIHLFVAILSEYLQGNKTATEARTAIETALGVTLSTDEAQDIVDVISYINSGNNALNKRNNLDELYRVLILAESNTWYNTEALIRTRLGWSTPV